MKLGFLAGELPATICKATSLEILDLSDKGLSGALPHCLGNLADKMLSLNFGDNQFRGTIPATFTKSCKLTSLNLNLNYFEGPVPEALSNCKFLKLLDIGHNKISGTFPSWLMPLRDLEVLILRSNKLHGTVDGKSTAHPFRKLRLVVLSWLSDIHQQKNSNASETSQTVSENNSPASETNSPISMIPLKSRTVSPF